MSGLRLEFLYPRSTLPRVKANTTKSRPVPKRKLLRPHGQPRFSIAEIDAGWAKVRELMRKESAHHAPIATH